MKVAVVGLGRFGMTLARDLGQRGVEVIAIDLDRTLVDEVKDDVSVAVSLDATNEPALESQEIRDVDVFVVAIGENFEAALLATVLAKKQGVPRIICRAQSAFHAEIFRQVGADEVIQPEMQAGERLAQKLANPHLADYFTLAENYSLIELHAPARFTGRTLQELSLRAKYGVNLVAIRRPRFEREDGEVVQHDTVISVPQPTDLIQPDDILVMVGTDEALARLPRE